MANLMFGQMLRGTAWSLLLRWALRGIGLINTIILARLLVPEDFGIVALAALVIGFLAVFSDLGVGLLLIRMPNPNREHCDTAWTIKVVEGAILAVLVAAAAPLAATFFREPRVEAVLLVMALLPLIGGFENIGIAFLMRDDRFGADFRFRISARLFLFLATLSLAFGLRDYWAIVYGALLGTVFQTGLSYAFRPHWPRLSLAKAREFLSFSVSLVAGGIGTFLANRLDVLLVGRLGTIATLGAYNIARELVSILSLELALSVARGSYPTYSSLARDRAAFSDAFYYSMSIVLILSVPLGFGLSVTASEFVAVVFGAKWTALAPLLTWISLFGVTHAATVSMSGVTLIAAGKEQVSAWSAWLQLGIRAVVILPVPFLWGAEAIAPALAVSGVMGIPAAAILLVRNTPITAIVLFRAAWRPLLAGILMVLVVANLRLVLFDNVFLRLFSSIAIGGITYGATLYALWCFSGRPAGPESAFLAFLVNHLPGRRITGGHGE